MSQYDLDGDGQLTYEEFMHAIITELQQQYGPDITMDTLSHHVIDYYENQFYTYAGMHGLMSENDLRAYLNQSLALSRKSDSFALISRKSMVKQ